MAGQNKDVSFKRALEQAKVILANPSFKEWLMNSNPDSDGWLKQLQERTKILGATKACSWVLAYYRFGGVMPTSMTQTSPIEVWSPKTKFRVGGLELPGPKYPWAALTHAQPDRVHLVLDPETTLSDMEHFLRTKWKAEVAPLLKTLSPRKRLKRSEIVLRDVEIRRKREEGASYNSLVLEYNLTKRRIEQITKYKS